MCAASFEPCEGGDWCEGKHDEEERGSRGRWGESGGDELRTWESEFIVRGCESWTTTPHTSPLSSDP